MVAMPTEAGGRLERTESKCRNAIDRAALEQHVLLRFPNLRSRDGEIWLDWQWILELDVERAGKQIPIGNFAKHFRIALDTWSPLAAAGDNNARYADQSGSVKA